MNKQMMIDQGYVPPTCTMPDPPAGMLIYQEVSAGRDPCAGCTLNREECKGRPYRGGKTVEDCLRDRVEETAQHFDRAPLVDIPEPCPRWEEECEDKFGDR